jgi:hypothetical protein
MRKFKFVSKKAGKVAIPDPERGAALVIAILVMFLLMGFLTVVVSRVTTETVVTSIDSSENRALAATQANLESTSRDFADIFERKLVPTNEDINIIKAGTITGFDNYLFTKEVRATKDAVPTAITGGTYSGLYSLRDEWEIDITAIDKTTEVETQLRRRFLNDRIPLFQFGIFYENDLELNRPPLFTFGGRVHTNSNLFISASPTANGNGIYFKSKTTIVGELVNDIWKTGTALTAGYDDQNSVFIADAGGVFRELNTGRASVNCRNPSGTNVFGIPNTPLYNVNLPNCSKRNTWITEKAIFQGNLETNTPRLDLPLKKLNVPLNEIIMRGKNINDMENVAGNVVPVTAARQDPNIISRERFANKEGLRITLADSQQRLPGCANVTTGLDTCGVRLDRTLGSSIGYQPLAMIDGYQATAFNATRFAQNGKQIWIKVELVKYDYNNNLPITDDITQDILSLGVTERAPVGGNFNIYDYSDASNPYDINDKDNDDIRSIIKLQRFSIPGPTVVNPSGISYLSNKTVGGRSHNFALRFTGGSLSPVGNTCVSTGFTSSLCGTAKDSFSPPSPSPLTTTGTFENRFHLKMANFNVGTPGSVYSEWIATFPIMIFDGREGLPKDSTTYTSTFATNQIPRAGVMSMIDIDIANLRRFLNGDFNGRFPVITPFAIAKGVGQSLRNTDVPDNRGWVLYISDRRGDADFDGEYDMEDVFPDNVLQFNEDVNGNGTLQESSSEAPDYAAWSYKSHAATSDHGYYRRGVRLINGSVLPGGYNSSTPNLTRGFTVAAETGVYVLGNYNATGVSLTGTTALAPSENYLPQGDLDVPAAIVSDAVTILSTNWQDSKSFVFPFSPDSRQATHTIVRFAMLAGQGITGKTTSTSYTPSQFGQLNGGVHNFKRYLEAWSGVRLNYSGSLVNLYTSRNNNGFFKCCVVYNPPIRDWTFNKTFLDPNRLPPGTPYIYTMSFTGFQRVSD